MAEVTLKNVWKIYTSTEVRKGESVEAVKDLDPGGEGQGVHGPARTVRLW